MHPDGDFLPCVVVHLLRKPQRQRGYSGLNPQFEPQQHCFARRRTRQAEATRASTTTCVARGFPSSDAVVCAMILPLSDRIDPCSYVLSRGSSASSRTPQQLLLLYPRASARLLVIRVAWYTTSTSAGLLAPVGRMLQRFQPSPQFKHPACIHTDLQRPRLLLCQLTHFSTSPGLISSVD